jgi:hypothetical protein
MLKVTVNLVDAGARAGLAAVERALTRRAALHEAMADRAGEALKSHLRARDTRSPNTHFYADAAASLETDASDAGAELRVVKRGMALRYYGSAGLPGGVVSAGRTQRTLTGRPTRLLALPTGKVPVRDGTRQAPDQMGLLAFIPSKKGGGVLVEGAIRPITRGPNKGATRVVPKEGGGVLYVLKEETRHQPDETVLPELAALQGAAAEAAGDFIAGCMEEGGAT